MSYKLDYSIPFTIPFSFLEVAFTMQESKKVTSKLQ